MTKFGCLAGPALGLLSVAALVALWEWDWLWGLAPGWVRPLVEGLL